MLQHQGYKSRHCVQGVLPTLYHHCSYPTHNWLLLLKDMHQDAAVILNDCVLRIFRDSVGKLQYVVSSTAQYLAEARSSRKQST